MSSRDTIIDDIYNDVNTIREKCPSMTCHHYNFESIKSLHGIHCLLQIEFTFHLTACEPERCRMSLRIVHPDMADEDDVDKLYGKQLGVYEKLSKENISLMLDTLLELLPTLQFNVFNGTFYPYIPSYSVRLAIKDFFKDIEGLQFNGNECCVCLELVKTKTECKHYLCIPCYQTLTIVEHERPCPMCRENIWYTN